jgi:hypothetical protein
MCKWKQELQDLIKKDGQHKENTGVAIKEQLNSFGGKQYFEDVVIPAFREIEKEFKDNGHNVWIHWEGNHAWFTIGYGAKLSDRKEYTKEVKYEITILGGRMKSRLYQLMGFGPQEEYPIDEHQLTDGAKGKSVDDITSEDIRDDFIVAYKAYVNK